MPKKGILSQLATKAKKYATGAISETGKRAEKSATKAGLGVSKSGSVAGGIKKNLTQFQRQKAALGLNGSTTKKKLGVGNGNKKKSGRY